MTIALPERIARLGLHGRADESQFAQNPEPVVAAMAYALASIHRESVDGLEGRTPSELEAARAHLSGTDPVPTPFGRVDRAVLRAQLEVDDWRRRPRACTHGAPVVSACVLEGDRVSFDDLGSTGADPVERDLAIVLRSIAEHFGAEATRLFVDAYEEAGGQPYDLAVIDWYSVVGAFR